MDWVLEEEEKGLSGTSVCRSQGHFYLYRDLSLLSRTSRGLRRKAEAKTCVWQGDNKSQSQEPAASCERVLCF